MGRVFAGQENFQEHYSYKTGYLFSLDVDGSLHIVDDGLHLGNGMGFSPNGANFYLVDSIVRKIYKFDYEIASGNISNKKIIIEFDRDLGIPDGMTVDCEGFLWVAMFFGGKIIRLDPDGKIEREILLPFQQPTSITFGGKEMNELFITSAALNWETKNFSPMNHDYRLPKGGSLYMIRTPVQGKKEYLADITLIMT